LVEPCHERIKPEAGTIGKRVPPVDARTKVDLYLYANLANLVVGFESKRATVSRDILNELSGLRVPHEMWLVTLTDEVVRDLLKGGARIKTVPCDVPDYLTAVCTTIH
jgi:hypothetical protein